MGNERLSAAPIADRSSENPEVDKGQDNQSSSNESYDDKLRTYTGSAPYLAQTLVPDFYKSNSAMQTFIRESGLDFAPAPGFTRETLEKRSELLYAMTRKIWQV